jgi:hypothetical protein
LGETQGYKQRKNTALKGLNNERVCAALIYGCKDREMIVNHIKNQKGHHKKESFENELRKLLQEQGIGVKEKYFP